MLNRGSTKPAEKAPQVQEEKAPQVPAQQPGGAVVGAIDYSADVGAGTEGADKDSFAIPFILVLQPLSPAVVDKLVAGAEAGLLMNSVTNDLFKEAYIVPCAFQRRWIRWAARETGGGFKGEHSTIEATDLRAKGVVKELEGRLYFPEQDGSVNPKRSDRLADTRSHFVLLLADPKTDLAAPAVLALTSTGIKRSKNFMSRIESLKMRKPDSSLYTPPSFSHMYKITTEKQTNEKGTWYEPVITMVGPVENRSVYAQARAFHDQVTKGEVSVAHDTINKAGGGEGGAQEDTRKGF